MLCSFCPRTIWATWTKCTEHASKKIRPSKNQNSTFSRIVSKIGALSASKKGKDKVGSFEQGVFSEQAKSDPFYGRRKKTINRKKFGGTPPLQDRKHPVDLSRLCCARCHVCPADILSNRCGITHKSGSGRPECPATRPQTVLGTLPKPINHQIPLCVLSLSVFSSPHSRSQQRSVTDHPPSLIEPKHCKTSALGTFDFFFRLLGPDIFETFGVWARRLLLPGQGYPKTRYTVFSERHRFSREAKDCRDSRDACGEETSSSLRMTPVSVPDIGNDEASRSLHFSSPVLSPH